MHVRVTKFQLNPDKISDVLETTSDTILPAIRNEAGYAGWVTLVDEESGNYMSLCLWDTEQDMYASEGSGFYKLCTSEIAKFAISPHTKETYQVAIQESVQDLPVPATRR